MRRGLTKSLSAGVSGEVGIGVWNLGAQAQATIANLALAFGEVRYSHTAAHSGMLFKGGIESAGSGISGRLEAIVPTSGYRDIAAQSGDGPVPRQFVGSLDFDLAQTLRFQLSATRQTRAADPIESRLREAATVLRAAGRYEVRPGITISGDVSYRRNLARNEVIAGLGLNIRFGPRSSALAAVRKAGNQPLSGQLSYFRPDNEIGQIGYAAHANLSEHNSRLAGTLAYRAPFARFSTDAEYASGKMAVRARADGSIVIADGGFFARDRSSEAYALVRTGNVGGVTVTHEHREVGKTNEAGRLLITRVTPLVPAQFDIAPDKLPEGAVARATYHRMQAARGGVVLVDMDIEKYRSVLLRLVDRTGEPLAVGSTVVSMPSGREYMVAFDGLVDFNALSGDTYLSTAIEAGQDCRTQLPAFDPDNFDMPQVAMSCIAGSTLALKD